MLETTKPIIQEKDWNILRLGFQIVENAKMVPIKIEYNAFKCHPLEYM